MPPPRQQCMNYSAASHKLCNKITLTQSLPVFQVTSSEIVAKQGLWHIISFLPVFAQICTNTMTLQILTRITRSWFIWHMKSTFLPDWGERFEFLHVSIRLYGCTNISVFIPFESLLSHFSFTLVRHLCTLIQHTTLESSRITRLTLHVQRV